MGGKSKSTTVGYWYLPAYHAGLGIGPIDAFTEFRGGDKPAWKGELTASGTININAPNLWGGEKDQGGIVGAVDVMFGEVDQQPNAYLISAFGDQQPAWRGLATLVFKGGKYGAMNPYPQKASYKIRKIKKGWDNDVCWYPETAEIPLRLGEVLSLGPTSTGWKYQVGAGSEDYIQPSYDDSGWDTGASPFASATGHPYVAAGGYPDVVGTVWPVNTTIWVRRRFTIPNPFSFSLEIFVDNYATVWVNGNLVLPRVGSTTEPSDEAFRHAIPVPASVLVAGENVIVLKAEDEGIRTYAAFKIVSQTGGLLGMNPAHILYYSRTQADMGREATASINAASAAAAADWYYSQGFGLCTSYDPSGESVEEFEQRIQRVAGCSISRSLVDGRWYIDVANGEYDLESLPILTDDDILEFQEQPTLLDSAVNSVSVKYFDPDKKEAIVTPPVQSPALVSDFGTNHLTIDYLEIPTAELAIRVAQRELLARITPLRGFSLKTTRKPYAWRPNTYFRLQAPKRGIADMVCILAEKSSGQLRSGAMSITATQDVYSLPEVAFVEVEPGVDTRPPVTPEPITLQAAFEAPYIEIVTAMSRADLAALPPETGFLMAVAADPATSRDYSLMVDAGAGYADTANGEWCATALIVEASGFDDSAFTLDEGDKLGAVAVGQAALWGSEIVRVDSIDVGTGAITLGRACADTVPVKHVAGERIWFYPTGAAEDVTEYTDGETLAVKLLTNTWSQQLALASAAAISVTFDSRAARPYPPAQLRINGEVEPAAVLGAITVSGVHRDRVQQADQLVDTEMAGIGPEAGTTYTVRYVLNGVLDHTDSGLATPDSTHTPAGAGVMRVEVEAVRDGLASWQMHVREFSIGVPLLAEDGSLITTEDNDTIILG